jgi:hypothetical protein
MNARLTLIANIFMVLYIYLLPWPLPSPTLMVQPPMTYRKYIIYSLPSLIDHRKHLATIFLLILQLTIKLVPWLRVR